MEISDITRDCYSYAGTGNGWGRDAGATTCSWDDAKDTMLADAEDLDGRRVDHWMRPRGLPDLCSPPLKDRITRALTFWSELASAVECDEARRALFVAADIEPRELAECYDALRDLDDRLETYAADMRNAADWLRECGEQKDALVDAIDSQPSDPQELAGDLEKGGYTLDQAHALLWRNGYITVGESLGEGIARLLDAISEGKSVG